MLNGYRTTVDNWLTGVVRLMLASIFLMAGLAKILVPHLADAFSGQLIAAGLPFYRISTLAVPYLELFLGIVLLLGFHARAASVAVIAIMMFATYVHVAVDDPSLFPLQPSAPIIPIAVMMMSLFILWRGAGAWSLDLKVAEHEI
jgi:uncharacterized membrane protein YphA (DoxX/SURF4 family)